MPKTLIESQIDLEEAIDLCTDFTNHQLSESEFCDRFGLFVKCSQPMNILVSMYVTSLIDDINSFCIAYRDFDSAIYQNNTLYDVVLILYGELKILARYKPVVGNGYALLSSEFSFIEDILGMNLSKYTKSVGGLIYDIRKYSSLIQNTEIQNRANEIVVKIMQRYEDMPEPANYIVKYLGIDDPFSLLKGKTYIALSIEESWYRIIDETGDDYLYPPENFLILGKLKENIEIELTQEEQDFATKYIFPKFKRQHFVVYLKLFYSLTFDVFQESSIFFGFCSDLCNRFMDKYENFDGEKYLNLIKFPLEYEEHILALERKSEPYMKLVDEAAKELGFVFLFDSDEGHVLELKDMYLEDMTGWLLPLDEWPISQELIKQSSVKSFDELPGIDEERYVMVSYQIDDDKIKIIFEYLRERFTEKQWIEYKNEFFKK